MRLSVVCETCDNAEVAACDSNDPQELRLLLLAAHASPPHNAPHRLKALINGATPANGTHEYVFRCLLPECGALQKEYVYKNCSTVDATLFVVPVHGEHEGHQLEIRRDGLIIHPPQ